MLYIKDLALVDPDDNMPLKTHCQFYQNPCNFVFEDVTLDIMFKQFKEGALNLPKTSMITTLYITVEIVQFFFLSLKK